MDCRYERGQSKSKVIMKYRREISNAVIMELNGEVKYVKLFKKAVSLS